MFMSAMVRIFACLQISALTNNSQCCTYVFKSLHGPSPQYVIDACLTLLDLALHVAQNVDSLFQVHNVLISLWRYHHPTSLQGTAFPVAAECCPVRELASKHNQHDQKC